MQTYGSHSNINFNRLIKLKKNSTQIRRELRQWLGINQKLKLKLISLQHPELVNIKYIILYTLNSLSYSYQAFKTTIRTILKQINPDDLNSLWCNEETNHLNKATKIHQHNLSLNNTQHWLLIEGWSKGKPFVYVRASAKKEEWQRTPINWMSICNKLEHCIFKWWHQTNL